ncbi:hypothetical protein ACLQ2S_18955 [Micromonospora sp. DT48]|uniref:hypothetical protein n=1 Tax=unclassified Micromonospora TaxID=2617518 RepID=UPI0012BC12E1|nr:hypothetical protein [Micromonospora sp. CP22]MTK01254.1 hypothetical protein [Micromonospora sp. CP22]
MAAPEKKGGDRRFWAWPVGILLGLVIGMAALDGAAGIGIGIGMGIAFALAFDATGRGGDKPDPDRLGSDRPDPDRSGTDGHRSDRSDPGGHGSDGSGSEQGPGRQA